MKTRSAVLIFLLIFMISCLPVKKTGSEEEFNRHLYAGLRYIQQKDYFMAKEELKLALNLNPNSVRANNLMGLAYFREKNYDYAEMYFQKAVKVDPKFAAGYLNIGAVYAMKELYPKAREYYERALAIAPDLIAAYYSLGAVYFQLGDQQTGISYLLKGLELDPDFLEKHSDSITGLPMKGSALPELNFAFAKLYASRGDIERTVDYLVRAKQCGFKDWKRIETEPEFASIKEDPRLKEFLK